MHDAVTRMAANLEHATLKPALSGCSFGIVSSRLPEALLLCAVLWLGLTSAGNSSCNSMPCKQDRFHTCIAETVQQASCLQPSQ